MSCLQWFDSIDLNRDGLLDVSELQKALAIGNLQFSLVTVAHMIRCSAGVPDAVKSSIFPIMILQMLSLLLTTEY